MTPPNIGEDRRKELTLVIVKSVGNAILSRILRYVPLPLDNQLLRETMIVSIGALFSSTFYLAMRDHIFVDKRLSIEEFLDKMEEKISRLRDDITWIKDWENCYRKAYPMATSETIKNSIERKLKDLEFKREHKERLKTYFETLKSSLEILKTIRDETGKDVDRVFQIIINLVNRGKHKEIKDKDMKKILNKLNKIKFNEEFPYVLREILEEKVKQSTHRSS